MRVVRRTPWVHYGAAPMNATQLRRTLSLLAAPAALVLTACNPLTIAPTVLDTNVYGAPAWYAGPPEGWIEATTTGTWGYEVAVVAGVQTEQLVGPADRWCATPSSGVVPCGVDADAVFTPEVAYVNGDPEVQGWTRLITVYPDEGVEVLIGCRNVFTGAFGCPDGTEVTIRTVTEAGELVGDLEEAQYVDGGAAVGTAGRRALRPGTP